MEDDKRHSANLYALPPYLILGVASERIGRGSLDDGETEERALLKMMSPGDTSVP